MSRTGWNPDTHAQWALVLVLLGVLFLLLGWLIAGVMTLFAAVISVGR